MSEREIESAVTEHLRRTEVADKFVLNQPFTLLAEASFSDVYEFHLNGEHLVCKVSREGEDRTLREALTMKAVRRLGFPAPPVVTYSSGGDALPRGMFVSGFAKGWNFFRWQFIILFICVGIAALPIATPPGSALVIAAVGIVLLTTAYAWSLTRLHQISVRAFRDVLEESEQGSQTFEEMTFNAHWLNHLQNRARAAGLNELDGVFNLLLAAPFAFDPDRQAVCHGDYHFWNVRCAPHVITVFDWAEASVAPPEFDVAWFLVLNEWVDLPRWNEDRLGNMIARAFYFCFTRQLKLVTRLYRIRQPLEPKLIDYFVLVHIVRGLTAIGETESSGKTWGMRTMKERLERRKVRAVAELEATLK